MWHWREIKGNCSCSTCNWRVKQPAVCMFGELTQRIKLISSQLNWQFETQNKRKQKWRDTIIVSTTLCNIGQRAQYQWMFSKDSVRNSDSSCITAKYWILWHRLKCLLLYAALVLKTESEDRNLRRVTATLEGETDGRYNKAEEYGMCRIPCFLIFTKYRCRGNARKVWWLEHVTKRHRWEIYTIIYRNSKGKTQPGKLTNLAQTF
jgi:hypothetical protein